MTLFDPTRHEQLVDDPWDEDRTWRAIETIVADTLSSTVDGFWPNHPLDDTARERGVTLYLGSAGVLLALAYLARVVPLDLRAVAWMRALPERYLDRPDTGKREPSYFLGESGVLRVALGAGTTLQVRERLMAIVEENARNPALELLWGAPGTMLAALRAHRLTSDQRFAQLYERSADALIAEWNVQTPGGGIVWEQDLYGRRRHFVGAGHGFSGNVLALLKGWSLHSPERQQLIRERARRTLAVTATHHGNMANWPPQPGRRDFLVQWCHGAPGIITSFADFPPDPEVDELLRQGGELIWRAGPLTKGPSLCHGTAGNGAAFLVLARRTGDDRWLERARRFAMHAIRQVEAARQAYGRGRYTLWTGDLGVGVYLCQCLRGECGVLSLDF